MSEFKFELGQTVKHVASKDYLDNKFVIIARGIIHGITGSADPVYLVTFCGGRSYINEFELTECTDK